MDTMTNSSSKLLKKKKKKHKHDIKCSLRIPKSMENTLSHTSLECQNI